MQITTGAITQEQDIAAGAPFLNVPWAITKDDVTLVEGVQAFPLAASSADIADFLSRKLTTYQENLALHLGAQELQAGLDNAAVVAEESSNLTVTT